MKTRLLILLLITLISVSCKNEKSKDTLTKKEETSTKNPLIYPEEIHFKDLRQVTFGGDNAEAYWSFDDKQLVFQSNNEKWNVGCDQMFLMNANETFTDSKIVLHRQCLVLVMAEQHVLIFYQITNILFMLLRI